jgi:hypothetical protein
MTAVAEQTCPAVDFQAKLIEIAGQLNDAIAEFMIAEVTQTANSPGQVENTAADIVYKYLGKGLKEFSTDAKGKIVPGDHWLSSEALAYAAEEGKTAVIKLDEHTTVIKRTARVGEDRSGYVPLAEKTAAEFGYKTIKALQG